VVSGEWPVVSGQWSVATDKEQRTTSSSTGPPPANPPVWTPTDNGQLTIDVGSSDT
jgi:hypothetical protein